MSTWVSHQEHHKRHSHRKTLQRPAGHLSDPSFLPSPDSKMHVTDTIQAMHTKGHVPRGWRSLTRSLLHEYRNG